MQRNPASYLVCVFACSDNMHYNPTFPLLYLKPHHHAHGCFRHDNCQVYFLLHQQAHTIVTGASLYL